MKRAIIIFLATFCWFGLFSFLGIDFHHDGIMFLPALRVSQGAVVFRDVFCQYGLLSPLLQGLAVKIFGAELLVLKLFTVLFYAGSALLLDWISRKILSKWFDLVPVVMFWLLMPDTMVTTHIWSSVFALFFSLQALVLLGKSFEKATTFFYKNWYLAGCGACCGLTFLARHPCGFFTSIAVAIAIAMYEFGKEGNDTRGKDFFFSGLWCFCGFAAVIAAGALYLTLAGAWGDYIFQCFTYVSDFAWQRGGSGDWGRFCIAMLPFVSEDMGFFNIIFAIVPLCMLWALWISVRKCSIDEQNQERMMFLFAVVLVSLGSWHQYYPVPCVRHLFWGSVPGMVAFAWTMEYFVRHCKERHPLPIVLLILCIAAFGWSAIPRIWGGVMRIAYWNERYYLNMPGVRGMALTRPEYQIFSHLRSTILQKDAKLHKRGVLNLTEDAIFTVLLPDCGFRHPQFLRMKNGLYADYDAKVAEFISRHKPLVITDDDSCFLPGYTPLSHWRYMGKYYCVLTPEDDGENKVGQNEK